MKKASKAPFSVGDLVTTEFDRHAGHVVRQVTECVKWDHCESGWMVSVDGGGKCSACGHTYSPIARIDSSWLKAAAP